MAKRTVRAKAEGRLTIPVVVEFTAAFNDLLEAITRAKAGHDVPLEWMLENAKYGSLDLSGTALAMNESGAAALDEIYDEWDELAKAAPLGDLDDFDPPIVEAMGRLARISRFTEKPVLLGSSEKDEELLAILPSIGEEDVDADIDLLAPMSLRARSRTSIRGIIVTCDRKNATYFTLQSASDGRNIRCYADIMDREKIGHLWAAGEVVLVEGSFSRYKKNPTMIGITRIVPLGQPDTNEWRQAIGCAVITDPKMSVSDAVRRFRDGEA